MDENWKKKITVIILSYNRAKFLSRTVNYYLKQNVKVLVIDGSKKKNSFRHNRHLNYIHTNKSYYDRLIIAYKNLRTKYYIIANDDEFYFFDAMKKSVNFLDKNKDYIAAIGQTIVFNYKNGQIYGYRGYEYFNDNKFDNNKKIERVKAHLNVATSQGYNSVARKKILKALSFFLTNYKFKENIYVVEFLMNLTIIIKGKLKIINNLMWFRSQENNFIKTKSWNRKLEHQHFFGSFKHLSRSNKLKQINNFCQIIKHRYLTKLILDKMSHKADHNHNLYIKNNNKKILNTFKSTLFKIKNKITFLYLFTEFFKNFFFYKYWYGNKIDLLINDISSKKIKVDYKNYSLIIKSIKEFYND